MKIFEVHITGDESIHSLGLKTIAVELLRPDYSVIRTEHMTSHVFKFPDFEMCLEHVNSISKRISNIKRIKIECPFYECYREQSIYLESHFITKNNLFPISKNAKKEEIMGTSRVYSKDQYDKFMEMWHGEITELCMYDTFVEEDADWLGLWEDPRKTGLKNGLRQLTKPQLQKVIDYKEEMVFDSFNYCDGKFCALAVGVGLEKMENPSHSKVYDKLIDMGYSVYNTRGIIGDFYTNNRKEDLLLAAKEVLNES